MGKEEKNITINFTKVKVSTVEEFVKILNAAIKQAEREDETQSRTGEPLTYKEIMARLYEENPRTFYPGIDGQGEKRTDVVNVINMNDGQHPTAYMDWDNCMTMAQALRIQAFNKLQNIAVYLNDIDWKPNFDIKPDGSYEKAYCIVKHGDQYKAADVITHCAAVYFQTQEKAEKAIELMGNDLLDYLFNTEWQ